MADAKIWACLWRESNASMIKNGNVNQPISREIAFARRRLPKEQISPIYSRKIQCKAVVGPAQVPLSISENAVQS